VSFKDRNVEWKQLKHVCSTATALTFCRPFGCLNASRVIINSPVAFTGELPTFMRCGV